MSLVHLTLNDFYLKVKNIVLILTRGLFFNFLQLVIFTFFLRCTTLLIPTLK